MVIPPANAKAVAGYLDEQVEQLRDQMPQAVQKFQGKAVHRTRVATRRLKAGLQLLEPVVGGKRVKRVNGVGRDLRRKLGPLRDLDVMIERLATLPASQRSRHGAALGWLTGRLEADRRKVRKKLKGSVDCVKVLDDLGKWWGLRQEVLEAGEATWHLIADAAHDQLNAFATEADYVSGIEPVPESMELDVHAVRIRAKALRYTLELADASGAGLPAAVHRTFKRMQDDLGAWHDHAVLAERAMRESLAVELFLHDGEATGQVLDLTKLLLRRGERSLGNFRKHWREGGDELQASIREAFPLTKPDDPPAADDHVPPVPVPSDDGEWVAV